MKGGGTLMDQYNRKYNTGGVNLGEMTIMMVFLIQ